jgi:hypothetical protein
MQTMRYVEALFTRGNLSASTLNAQGPITTMWRKAESEIQNRESRILDQLSVLSELACA